MSLSILRSVVPEAMRTPGFRCQVLGVRKDSELS
jgi:hypothetical protein